MTDAGDYYEQCRREAAEAHRELREAEARGASLTELKRLKERLELALYTGD